LAIEDLGIWASARAGKADVSRFSIKLQSRDIAHGVSVGIFESLWLRFGGRFGGRFAGRRVDFAEVFDALVLRVAEICLFVFVSAIALRLGGILDVCCWSIETRKRRKVRGERGES
jgi:hypothetical protein